MEDTLLFATGNLNKLNELREMIGNSDFPINIVTNTDLTNPPYVVANGANFVDHAIAKAHRLAEFSGLPTLVDASGLMVDHLNGAPGLSSSRYAGELYNDEMNNAKLLAALGGVPAEKRTAHLHTALVLSWPGFAKEDLITEGDLAGRIQIYPSGEENYGYDSLFYVPALDKTLAEMSIHEKNQISHRGQAMRKMLAEFPNWWQKLNQLEMQEA